jgi:hypothetical protein
MKAIGAGMAVGGVAAALTNAVAGSSMKRTIKKTVKKAGNALTDMMSNAQSMMK